MGVGVAIVEQLEESEFINRLRKSVRGRRVRME